MKIVDESNRYAATVTVNGKTRGGEGWWKLTLEELQAWIGISMLMGVKPLPNHRAYWRSSVPFLHCPVISSCMSRSRFERITACLHIVDDRLLPTNRGDANHDKLGKVRWLLQEVRRKCQENWNLGQMVTVDEMMVRYKGRYCPIRQYMPNKPCKWGIKVWCVADASRKYVYDFEVYTGASVRESLVSAMPGEAKTGYEVVMNLMESLHGRGHMVFIDNFFTSVKLLIDMLARGTFATGTVRSNRKGLPPALSDKKLWEKKPQGSLGWLMHNSRKDCVCHLGGQEARASSFHPRQSIVYRF